MALEIERRFIASPRVLGDCRGSGRAIVQGYLWSGRDGNARVRVDDRCGFLTCKGPKCGCCREETEISIPKATALDLLATLPADSLIRKTRYTVPVGGMDWVVDVFDGRHRGLIIAEIELSHPAQMFLRPDWALREVTWETAYGNSALARAAGAPAAA